MQDQNQSSFNQSTNPANPLTQGSTMRTSALATPENVPIHTAGVKPPANKKPLIIAIVALTIVAAGAVLYFFVFKNQNRSETATTVTEGLSASGPNASADIQKQLDNKINQSSDAQEILDAKLSKASFMIMDEEYDSALALLGEIDPSNLSDYDQYRLYNYFSTVYKGLGNNDESDRYHQLAEAAHERDLSSYRP